MRKILEILRPANFFEYFDEICIRLIIIMLSLNQNSRLFVLVEKSLQMLNFHFGRKYHFVKLNKLTFVMFLPFLVAVFTNLSFVTA